MTDFYFWMGENILVDGLGGESILRCGALIGFNLTGVLFYQDFCWGNTLVLLWIEPMIIVLFNMVSEFNFIFVSKKKCLNIKILSDQINWKGYHPSSMPYYWLWI